MFLGYDERAAKIAYDGAISARNSAVAAGQRACDAASPVLKRQGTVAIAPPKRDYADGRDPEVIKRIDAIRLDVLCDPAKKLHFERSIARFCRVQVPPCQSRRNASPACRYRESETHGQSCSHVIR